MQARRELQKLVDAQARVMDRSASARGFDSYYGQAMAMLQSPKLRDAFNISAEPQRVRDSYGRTTEGGWDTHGFNNTRMFPIIEKYHLPITEQTLPTLLTELDERGLLDTTLVV